jgi:DNA polymerase-3 subunit beta
MKLEINKEKISQAINKSEKISTKNSTLPVLECVLLDFDGENLNLKSTNLDISLSVSVRVKGDKENKVLVPAATLNSFLSNLPKNDSVVTFETEGNNLHITSESTDTTINTQPVDDFPVMSDEGSGKEFKINSTELLKGLNSVWYSTATSSIKPELSSVYLYADDGDLIFVATDSFRLAEYKLPVKDIGEFESVLIPYKNVVEIIRIFEDLDEEITLYFKDDQIIIQSENIKVVSRVVEGNFPDYNQIIPKETKTEMDVLKEDLSQGLKLSNIFSDNFNQVVFSIMPEDKIFEITSNSNNVGETKNIIKAKSEGENLKISFNSKYITDCFQSIKSDGLHMKFNGLDKPMIIQGSNEKNFLYLVMPMNK